MPAPAHYRRNDALRTIRPGYPGNKLIGKEFCNGEALYEPTFGTAIRWQLTANPQKEEKKRDTWTPQVVYCRDFLQSTQDGLVWLGHSSFVLRIEGTTLLFDPVLFSSLGLARRHALPCLPEDLKNIDFLLLSHGHRDHLDEASVKLVAKQNPNLEILAPLAMTQLLRGMAPKARIQEAGWWQEYAIDWDGLGWLEPDKPPFKIYFLPASHWHRRGLTDLNKVLWGSFLIKTADDRLIYFAGDTSYGDHFEQIEQTFGPLDIVLMPIGAYKPPFMMHMSHVNPHEAAKAANVLRAGHLVPMHYGTFDLSDEPASEPLRLLTEVAAGGLLRGELHAPAVGEVLDWTKWE
jgi:L-ascorbate metabolism protein UlaG (beta-lactamase superfamily)